ncbi:hypothetical protein ACJJTC_000296 [Scirpophaga incertulas]
MWLMLLWATFFVTSLVLYYRQQCSTFKRRGLKYVTPVPVLGNMATVALGLEHFTDYLKRIYNKYPNERFIGNFEFTTPVLFIRDLELIKQIAIKDFEHFLDHRTVVDDKVDPFWGRNLFSLKGHEWRDMRSTLSPAFTSAKIRNMVPFMTEVGEHMVRSIKTEINKSGSNSVVVETKDMTMRYSNDVIASCAFGLKVDSHNEPDNVFFDMSKDATSFKWRQLIVFFAYNSFPKIMSMLKLSVFSKATMRFFKALISNTMKERETRNIVRPDMIHLLMEAKKGQLSYDEKTKDTAVGFATVEESDFGKQKTVTDWSEDDLIAQALIFLLGGLETVSSVTTFALLELAIHPDAQEKLVKEIKEYHERNKGVLDFQTLQSMVYMDMVVSEVLRLWTPGFMIDRRCIKDYNLGKPNKEAKEDYIIRKGEGLIIPVWAFHRNPDYFPDPDKFDPERFAEENKGKMNPNAYLPFGIGPRNCIGSRFALCDVKAILYQTLLNFEVSPTEKTTIPLALDKSAFSPRVKNGAYVNFRIRKEI